MPARGRTPPYTAMIPPHLQFPYVHTPLIDFCMLKFPCSAQTLAEQLSYLQYARPFKNPNYTKNVNRRTKNLKAVLTQEREREKNERERRRQEKEENMDVDGEQPAEDPLEDDLHTCE